MASQEYLNAVNRALESFPYPTEAVGLYAPVRYALESGGKRIRPVLLLSAYEWVSGRSDWREAALPAAVAVEVFHNFTLLHDDIMDRSDLRRGVPTVQKKWGENAAILSGDAMCILAYRELAKVAPKHIREVLETFNWLAMAVCQGQQYDMEFESRASVGMEEYIRMIYLKTSALIEGALRIGTQLGEGSEAVVAALGKFGKQLGLAFQLQDDMLDTYGETKTFGKECGDDICDNKRTYLSIWAETHADADQLRELRACQTDAQMGREEKVRRVVAVYDAVGTRVAVEEAIAERLQAAREALAQGAKLLGRRGEALEAMVDALTGRSN